MIVNPPRRGIGEKLVQYLNELQPRFCYIPVWQCSHDAARFTTLIRLSFKQVQLFDMFSTHGTL